MFKKNVNTSQLAREVNLHQQTVQRIVSGCSSNPHEKTLQPIADYFEISVEQLKGKKPLPESFTDISFSKTPKCKAKHIPIIPWNDVENYLNDPENYQAEKHTFADQDMPCESFAVISQDFSMEPHFPKGSLLILNPNFAIQDSCFVLTKIAESKSTVFRKLLLDGEYKYLRPTSPDLKSFPPYLLSNEDRVLGGMIEVRKKYDA